MGKSRLEELENLINEKGFKLKSLAENMGLTYGSLRNKLDGRTEFKVSEMISLSELVNLSSEEMLYFFNLESEYKWKK